MSPHRQGNLTKAAELFRQEARQLHKLGHHNQIPALLLYYEQDGKQYIVQEFIDGQNLAQVLDQQGRFNQKQIQEVLLDLLPVLQFIHKGQVIHRDVKPENIIRRNSDGKLVLVDFGAAKHATTTALSKTGTKIGSAEYAAPEQGLGHAIFASDIYGLGVTCLHLLTNITPFDLYSALESAFVWRQFLNGNVVDEKLNRVLDKMTQQRVPDRYQSVEAVLQDLEGQVPSASFNAVPQKVKAPANKSNKLTHRGIQYQQLEDYLRNGQWKEADHETYRLMITTVGKEEGKGFTRNELLNFPCDVLKAIDGLWVKYSDGKFGFSVQKQIYVQCGGTLDGFPPRKSWNKFTNQVGWCHFDGLGARRKGRFPSPLLGAGLLGVARRDDSLVISFLASRLVDCNL